MGGGGSINYSMLHESTTWLIKQFGYDEAYWDQLKKELNTKFNCTAQNKSPVTKHVINVFEMSQFKSNGLDIEHISSNDDTLNKQLIPINTQFDIFGNRAHSGVSILNWDHPCLHLEVNCSVESIEMSPKDSSSLSKCCHVNVKLLEHGKIKYKRIALTGKLVLCAGAQTPRLLMPHRHMLNNPNIGMHVNDHIIIPIGIYAIDKSKLDVRGTDIYLPLFEKECVAAES